MQMSLFYYHEPALPLRNNQTSSVCVITTEKETIQIKYFNSKNIVWGGQALP